jgi:hypothetical protein
MYRIAAAALVAAALLSVGCSGQPGPEQAQLAPEQIVIAKPVEPLPLEDDKTSLPSDVPHRSLPTGEQDPAEPGLPTEGPAPARQRARQSGAILSAADRASFGELARSLGGQHGIVRSSSPAGRRGSRRSRRVVAELD